MFTIKLAKRSTRRAMIQKIEEQCAIVQYEIGQSAKRGWYGPTVSYLMDKHDGLTHARDLWKRVWSENRFKGDAVALRQFVLACNRACVEPDYWLQKPDRPVRRGYGKAVAFAEEMLTDLKKDWASSHSKIISW